MSLTVTRERKVGDSHGVTPSAPVHQLRRNGGCADVAVEAPANDPTSAGANVAVAPKLPSSSSSLLSSSGERSNFSSVEYQSHIRTEDSRIASPRPIGPPTFYPRTLDPRHPMSSGPKSVTPGIGMYRASG